MMYWAVRTTLCNALRSDAKQLPYQAVMQPVRMLSIVQLERIRGPMPNLFSLLRGNRRCLALFTTVLVCVDHDRAFVRWTLEALEPLQREEGEEFDTGFNSIALERCK